MGSFHSGPGTSAGNGTGAGTIRMDEEIINFEPEPLYNPISVCKCLTDQDSSEAIIISDRKRRILTTVSRTENYLKERRIPELVRFILSKLLAERSNKPVLYMDKLINDCMLFRAGHGVAPVLYENKHLEAVVKSFDPGQRGWLSAGQTRRAFITLGLQPDEHLHERNPYDEVLNSLQKKQETELFDLLCAGIDFSESTDISKSNSSDT
ncbi:hypothetical protein evm_012799 [Chilo suppressalis]|nr:hypothetical protein evm_012799 [Chilo suppressalis]